MWNPNEDRMAKTRAKSFEDLVMWQRSHALVLCVYKATGTFPKHELYGLTSQIRRAAVSVPANIAEAFKKRSKPDKARVMNIAQASLEELRYYTILSRDLGYLAADSRWDEVEEVARMLGSYTEAILASAF
jgi:four helix bundle protein